MALTALILSSFAVFLTVPHGGDADSVRLVIRLTARVSLGFFCLAFSASAGSRLWPNAWTRWQLTNRRYLGLSFAVSHVVHAFAIWALVARFPRQFHKVHPGSNIPGEIGYLFLFAMTITSFDRTAAFLGNRAWRILHTTGAYVLWVIFLVSEASRMRQGAIHVWFAALLLVPMAIRFMGWRAKARPHGCCHSPVT